MGHLTACKILTPMPPRSPKNYRKADRKLKHDKGPAKSMDGKTIQDYFISCDKTPFKEGDKQKLPVVHSPPTPTEELNLRKSLKCAVMMMTATPSPKMTDLYKLTGSGLPTVGHWFINRYRGKSTV